MCNHKRRAVIYSPVSCLLNPNAINRGYGGADSHIYLMNDALVQAGYHVTIYAHVTVKTKKENTDWIPFRLYDSPECDIFIQQRKPDAPFINAKKKIYMLHDDIDAPVMSSATSIFFSYFDTIIFLSKYQLMRFISVFPEINQEKCIILKNGVQHQKKEECQKRYASFIYASTPFRGLPVLAKIWKKILIKYPVASLNIFSSMKLYDMEDADLPFMNLYAALKRMNGVTYHGCKPQTEVIKYMKKSQILLYPNTFPETFCNVVYEARSCFTPIITTRLGSLPEVVEKAGILVQGSAYTSEYQDQMLNSIDIMLDPKKYLEFQSYCYPIKDLDTWKKEFIEVVET